MQKKHFHQSNRKTAILLGAFGLLAFSYPFLTVAFSQVELQNSDKPLPVNAIRRGAFNNSGSRDMGPDSR